VVPGTPAQEIDERRLVAVLLATAFLTGLSSFIYEIVWIRMLSLVLGASTHAFEIMLAAFILGLALGGMYVRKIADEVGSSVRFLAIVQLVMGVTAAATVPLYNGGFDLMAWMLSSVARTTGGFVIFNLTSTAIALLVMLPATFCAGMTLPLITYRLLRSRSGERALGLVYAVNTVGAIAGVIVAVHFLLRSLGLHGTLVVGAAIDVLLGVALLLWLRPAATRSANAWPAIAGLAALAFVAIAFDVDDRRIASGVFRTGVARLAANNDVLFHRDGKTATVDVVQTDKTFRAIRTNGKSDASINMLESGVPSRDEYTMTLLGLLPLGHRPDAKRAAIIGFGSGMSTSVMLAAPGIERVDTIEIEPSMLEGAQLFRPLVDPAFDDPRSRIVIDDAKSYFARGRMRYDIIVSEPSNPWVSGVSSLFTEEFYARLAGYLNEGGVLSQWLHTYEMDTKTLSSILAAVSKTFPEFVIYTSIDSDIILVARKGGDPGNFDPAVMKHPKLQPLLTKLKMTDPALVERRVVSRWSTVRAFIGSYGATPNSDYYPLVDQRAAKSRFTQDRVEEFTMLQASPIPLLDIFDPAAKATAPRGPVIPVTYSDYASLDAAMIRETLLGERKAPAAPFASLSEMNASVLRHWALDCPADLPFERVLPIMTFVADRTNPNLTPQYALGMWAWLSASRCGKALGPEQRQWLDLFTAVAARDVQRMSQVGTTLLGRLEGQRTETSEYAFLAATAGLVCRAEMDHARNLIGNAYKNWVREDMRKVEVRFLAARTRNPDKCAAAS